MNNVPNTTSVQTADSLATLEQDQLYPFAYLCACKYEQVVGDAFCREAPKLNRQSGAMPTKYRNTVYSSTHEAVFDAFCALRLSADSCSADRALLYLYLYKQMLRYFDARQSRATSFAETQRINRQRLRCIKKLKTFVQRMHRQNRDLLPDHAKLLLNIDLYFLRLANADNFDPATALAFTLIDDKGFIEAVTATEENTKKRKALSETLDL